MVGEVRFGFSGHFSGGSAQSSYWYHIDCLKDTDATLIIKGAVKRAGPTRKLKPTAYFGFESCEGWELVSDSNQHDLISTKYKVAKLVGLQRQTKLERNLDLIDEGERKSDSRISSLSVICAKFIIDSDILWNHMTLPIEVEKRLKAYSFIRYEQDLAISQMNSKQLKQVLSSAGLPTKGKVVDLQDRVVLAMVNGELTRNFKKNSNNKRKNEDEGSASKPKKKRRIKKQKSEGKN